MQYKNRFQERKIKPNVYYSFQKERMMNYANGYTSISQFLVCEIKKYILK